LPFRAGRSSMTDCTTSPVKANRRLPGPVKQASTPGQPLVEARRPRPERRWTTGRLESLLMDGPFPPRPAASRPHISLARSRIMARYRNRLPQLDGGLFLTDGGAETTLIFHEGIDLPCFAAFILVDDDAGRETLRRY